jgi:hypothetical protein
MKNHGLILVFLALIQVGCLPMGSLKKLTQAQAEPQAQTQLAPKPVPTTPKIEVNYFNGDTDADILMKSILDMDLPVFDERRTLLQKRPIVIGSLENPADSESNQFPVPQDPIEVFIEDALTQKLTTEGFRVAERDLDILSRLFHESGNDYLISIAPDAGLRRKEIIDEDGQVKKQGLDLPEPNYRYIRYPYRGLKPLQHLAPLQAADYVLAYRVLECGVTYRPTKKDLDVNAIEEGGDGSGDRVERIAVTKLHLRLTNERGVIVWSRTVTGKTQSVILAKHLPFARSPTLHFAGHKNPIQEYKLDLNQAGSVGSQDGAK